MKNNVKKIRGKLQQRREFLVKSGVLITGAVSSSFGLTAGSEGRKKGQNGPSMNTSYEIFDCHLHSPADSGEAWQWYRVTGTFDDFVKYLDRTGVKRGIINSQRSYGIRPEEFIAGNREAARNVDKYRGRFIGACVVNPQFIDEALKEIEYCHDQLGFVWVGELCNYMVPYDYSLKEFEALVRKVTELNMRWNI